jgi:hypothetical protein
MCSIYLKGNGKSHEGTERPSWLFIYRNGLTGDKHLRHLELKLATFRARRVPLKPTLSRNGGYWKLRWVIIAAIRLRVFTAATARAGPKNIGYQSHKNSFKM